MKAGMTMNKRGKLVIVSGPSGVGKGTVLAELFAMSDEFALSVSATTRAPREGEKEGINYFYKSKEEFEKMIEENMLLEYAPYNDNYYGTPKAYVDAKLDEGKNVILEIEVQGAMKVKSLVPDAVMIFVAPESKEILLERLTGRGTEEPDVIANRIAIAEKELRACLMYDYITVNEHGKAKECAENILAIVRAEKVKKSNMFDAVSDFIL